MTLKNLFACLIVPLITGCSTMTPKLDLPDYVTADLTMDYRPSVLKTPANTISFPLSAEDKRDVEILEAKFDNEVNCAGLAAPQIGIAKRITVFAAPENPEFKKWRPDFDQTMDKTIWINPSYEGVGNEKIEDVEGCFSISGMVGTVNRFKEIEYEAQLVNGDRVKGRATGFLARLMQHEIDHLNGKLCLDNVPAEKMFSIEVYREMRAKAMESSGEEKH
jgi:peptide deformylase